MRPPARLIPALLLALVPAAAALAAGAPAGLAPVRFGLGLDADGGWPDRDPIPPGLAPAGEAGPPLYLRLPVGPAELASGPRVASRLEALASAGFEPILVLEPPPLPAGDLSGLGPWLRRVDGLLQSLAGRPVRLQAFRRPPPGLDAALQARVLKRVSVAVRAAAPGSRIATWALDSASAAADLADHGIGPYVDAFVLTAAAAADGGLTEARRALPRAEVWLEGLGATPGDFVREAVQAFGRGVALAVAAPAGEPPERLRSWSRLLAPEAVLVPAGFRRVDASQDGAPLPADGYMELERNGERFVAVFAPAGSGPLVLTVRGPRVSTAWIRDLVSGEEVFGASADWLVAGDDPGSSAVSRLQVTAPERPLLLRLGRVGAFPPPSAREEVRGVRSLSLEEILARHREVQAAQDRVLRTLQADVRIDYRFSVANLDQTFDVTTFNRFYHDGSRAAYEELELFINGARWTGDRVPDLPFVIPGRVTEVPLDLRLDGRYSYSLEGREELEKASVYVLTFRPAAGTSAPYSGRVWIDAASFVKRRMEAVEIKPELPVVSNRLVQDFHPVNIGGRTWWLMDRLVGQMVFSALGRNVLLERDLIYTGYRVNDDRFEQRLEEAYDSERPVLEETAEGFRRLTSERGPGGTRVRRANEQLGRQGVSRLLVAGWSLGDDLDFGFPFAGVNYFNFDWRGTGTQLDVAWAGPFLNVIWSDPSLGGSRAILSLEGRILPLYRTNRRIDTSLGLEGDVREERVEESRQLALMTLGYPVGSYHRLQAALGLDHVRYRREDRTAPDFTIPSDTWETTLAAGWNWSRLGWRLDAELLGGRRSPWRFWGGPDGDDFEPGDDTYVRSSLVLNKFFFREAAMDKFGFRISLYDGHGLDRFSRFALGDFGTARVSGYNGDGIRFDTGGVLDLNGSIDLGTRTRLDLFASHGRFRNEEDLGPGTHHVTGAGFALNFSGPFSSFMRVRVATGLDSSLREADGGADLRVTFFRTFQRWFWQKKAPVVTGPGTEKKAPEPARGAGAVP